MGQLVAREIEKAVISKESNTIAVDDGIAMGHGGMLYSPSRELIADSVEYMVNAHVLMPWCASPTVIKLPQEC